MDELGFLNPFNSISVIPRWLEGEHEGSVQWSTV